MAIFVAEIEVEPGPLMVVRALGRRHLCPFQPPLKGYPSFSSNLLHRNMFAVNRLFRAANTQAQRSQSEGTDSVT